MTDFLRRHNTHIYPLTPDCEPTTDRSVNSTEVQLGKSRSFIGVTYRNEGQGLLKGA